MAARGNVPGNPRGQAGGSVRDDALIRVCDLAGRPRGTGFLADADGTMITSHEAVDGLARLVLHAPGDQVCLVEAEAITALPEYGVALVATEGIVLPALPVAAGGPAHPEGRITLRLPHRVEGTVIGTTSVTYTATDRFHLLDEVYELALDGADLNRVVAQASGTPLIDAATGAVLAVVVTALHAGHRASGFAVPLRAGSAPPALAEVLARNAAAVPAYGPHLNLAGALQLTGTSVGSVAGPGRWREPVARPELDDQLGEFLAARGELAPLVLGLVGDPGTGRSTVLARLAARRARGPRPAPTVWLRGAELRPGDGGIKDAVERSLRTAARIVCAAGTQASGPAAPLAEPRYASPDAVAALACTAGRPLLVLLDAPEEMPPLLAHALADWTAATAGWLRTSRARLVLASRPELWEQVGALLPAGLLYGVGSEGRPPCVRVGDLAAGEAVRARALYGLPAGALADADAAHPLALRLLSEVRAALPEGGEGEAAEFGEAVATPSRAEIFSGYLDLVCLRIAVRLAAGREPRARGTGLRQLAARVAGQVHEAARRCLGPGQGELDREAFEELFPWRTGWASAVLTEGLLVPAGAGYRFAHEELADWLQALHLDLAGALHALVHRWFAAPGASTEAPVCLPSRPAARAGQPPPVPPAPPIATPAFPRTLPVPRHRAGPVLQALLHAPPPTRTAHLHALLHTLDHLTPPPTRLATPTPEIDREADTVPTPYPAGTRAVAEPGGKGSPEPGRSRTRSGPRPPRDTVPTPHPAATRATAQPGGQGEAGPPGVRPSPSLGSQASASSWPVEPPGLVERQRDAVWWAAHLVREALRRTTDAGVLRELAGRVVVRAVEQGGFEPERMGGLGEFGPAFWRTVPLTVPERLELLRVMLPADGPPEAGEQGERFLDAVAELLHAHPAEALPAVCTWFPDDRPLQTGPAPTATGPRTQPRSGGARLTVASAAQALLHTHRRLAVDDLTEGLIEAAHPAADEVLAALAEDEPSAMCRAVDRWAHDPRPDRHVAAATYGMRAAAQVRSEADRELLRYAALAILARPGDCTLHGAALGLLVRDPATRARHLPAAVRQFATGDDPGRPDPAALATALATHPEAVLTAFRARLDEDDPEQPPSPAGTRILTELAVIGTPALARRAAALVEDHLRRRPAAAPDVARFLDLRLEQGPGARAVLLPFAAAVQRDHPARVRRVLVPVFAAPGTHLSRPLRQELLECVLDTEHDPAVLEALLTAAADHCRQRHPVLTRDLAHRLGLLLCRTPEGAALFDRRVVELAAAVPDFAVMLRAWLADGGNWDAVVGPSARRRLESVA